MRRRTCALALSGRIPSASVPALLDVPRRPDVTQALADEERMVAREAYDRLVHVTDHHDELHRMVADRAPGHVWALAVLAARGEPIDDQWEALGRPRVDVPGLPEDVREAIVREYVPGTRDIDPLWLLEAVCLPDKEPPDPLPLAMAALAPLDQNRTGPAGVPSCRRDPRQDRGHRPAGVLLRPTRAADRARPAVLLAGLNGHFTACFTRATMRASTSGVISRSAKAVGHMSPSSRLAACSKPRVA